MHRACALKVSSDAPSCSTRTSLQIRGPHATQPRHTTWQHSPPAPRLCHILTRADKQQDNPNIVEGYDIEQPDIWESEMLGTGLRAAFVALCVALVVVLVYLATPLIDYVVDIYPSPEALTQVGGCCWEFRRCSPSSSSTGVVRGGGV